jgi:CDP-diglyceride synthetase
MSSWLIPVIILTLVFAAALAGMAVGARLPDHHRSDASHNVVSVSMAVVGTLTALVLGLLLSLANTSFGTEQQQLISISTELLRIDQLLRAYGPEADGARAALRQYAAGNLRDMFPPDGGPPDTENHSTANLLVEVARMVLELTPAAAHQRWVQGQVVGAAANIGQTRWQLAEERRITVPTALLVLLVFWLMLLFGSYGLFAPRHATTIVVLFLSVVAASGAIMLIIDLEQPWLGVIHLSADPLQHAIAVLNR